MYSHIYNSIYAYQKCNYKMFEGSLLISSWQKREHSCYNNPRSKAEWTQLLHIIRYRFHNTYEWDLSGNSSANSTFDLSIILSHLLTCLQNGQLTNFLCNPKQQRFSDEGEAYMVQGRFKDMLFHTLVVFS